MKGEGALNELDRAVTLHRTADGLYAQRDFAAATKLYKEAMTGYERSSGKQSMEIACCFCQLGKIHMSQKNWALAEPLISRALALDEKYSGPHSYVTGHLSGMLATVYYNRGKFDQALPLYQKALAIYEKQAPELANCSGRARMAFQLANIYYKRKDYVDAEPLYKLSIKLYSQSDVDPPHYLSVYRSLEALLRTKNRSAEADEIARQEKAMMKTARRGKALDEADQNY